MSTSNDPRVDKLERRFQEMLRLLNIYARRIQSSYLEIEAIKEANTISIINSSDPTKKYYFKYNATSDALDLVFDDGATETMVGRFDVAGTPAGFIAPEGFHQVDIPAEPGSLGYLYAGLGMSPGRVYKIDLATFATDGYIDLTAATSYNKARALAKTGSYLYIGTYPLSGTLCRLVRVALSSFMVDDFRSFAGSSLGVYGLDIADNVIYAGCLNRTGYEPVSCALDTLDDVAETLSTSISDSYQTLSDGTYLWVISNAANNVIKLYNVADLSAVSPAVSATLSSGQGGKYRCAVLIDGYLYIGIWRTSSSAAIVRFDAVTMTNKTTFATGLSVGNNMELRVCKSADGAYIYTGSEDSPCRVSKVRVSDGTVVTLDLDAGENNCESIAMGADGYLYVGLDTSPGKLVKVNPTTMARAGVITFSAGEDSVLALA